MERQDLIIKFIEQTAEVTHAKIDVLNDKIEALEKDNKGSIEDHKQHEKIAFETRYILDAHLRSDDTYQKSINSNLSQISQILERNTTSLQEHMKRTDLLEKLHQDNQKRITLLEEPGKFLTLLKKYVKYLLFIGGAAAAITKWLSK
jgi:hypothetical protein